MVIAIALLGFNYLGHLVTPTSLLIDHFLQRFSMFSEKMKKIYWLEIWIFCKMHHGFLLFLALCLSVWRFQMFLQEISFVKALSLFGIIYTKDPLLQNIRSFASVDSPSIFLTTNPWRPCWIMCTNFFKMWLVFYSFYLWNKVGDPDFLRISDTRNSIFDLREKFKNLSTGEFLHGCP